MSELFLLFPASRDGGGWPTLTASLAQALARRCQVRLIPSTPFAISDALDRASIEGLMHFPDDFEMSLVGAGARVGGPVIQALLDNRRLRVIGPRIKGTANLGYVFFEEDLDDAVIASAHEDSDVIVCGATWCEDVLRRRGLERVTTVVQGVDPQIFNEHCNDKSVFRDRFVVFSGGKAEYRKGTDLVLRAVSILQRKHRDVFLMTAWAGDGLNYVQTLFQAQGIHLPVRQVFAMHPGPTELIKLLLSSNGVDLDRTLVLPFCTRAEMARAYKNTDVGLFPNRCEGGTNLVMMEYMACGKAAIATHSTGHLDVLTADNSVPLRKLSPRPVLRDGKCVAHWPEPDLDEIVAALEWAYDHPNDLARIGARGAADMRTRFTWDHAAQAFIDLCAKHT